ncbi:hypothetical protein [Acinetobacter towneri]|uniref:hypothetical protein n=1 Tax=Acinetobacter towneri TaxID=202956 RepID=UPI001F266DCE|nr:hypothetical protein [Acinetobacter towneri]UIP24517.1 hypothetical protein LZG54_10220 [Acinetobacter towneri]
MIKNIGVVLGCVLATSCASIPKNQSQVQLLRSDSTLINGCKKLGPINTDTRGNGFNYNAVAEEAFKRIALEKYQADAAVITDKKDLSMGRIILQGTALKCYP